MTAQFQDLRGKQVLVTGALRGLGLACCRALARNGAHLVVNYRSRPEEAQKLCRELKDMGAGQALSLCFDVSNYTQLKEALQSHVKEHGPIQGIVNNAGISRDTLLLRLKEEDVDATIDTNLKGALYVIQALSRTLLKVEDASIVNVGSIVGMMGNTGQTAYAAAKAGLLGMTKSVAKELGGKNVRCNAICPGFIDTDMTQALDSQRKEVYLSQIPLKRFGEAEEVADLVSFLLSRASAYITGETIKIDGGLYI